MKYSAGAYTILHFQGLHNALSPAPLPANSADRGEALSGSPAISRGCTRGSRFQHMPAACFLLASEAASVSSPLISPCRGGGQGQNLEACAPPGWDFGFPSAPDSPCSPRHSLPRFSPTHPRASTPPRLHPNRAPLFELVSFGAKKHTRLPCPCSKRLSICMSRQGLDVKGQHITTLH